MLARNVALRQGFARNNLSSCRKGFGTATVRHTMLRTEGNPVKPQPSEAHTNLLYALGGPSKVAEIVNIRLGLEKPLRPQAVSNWVNRGIPFCYRAVLTIEANERDIDVPAGFLNEGIQ